MLRVDDTGARPFVNKQSNMMMMMMVMNMMMMMMMMNGDDDDDDDDGNALEQILAKVELATQIVALGKPTVVFFLNGGMVAPPAVLIEVSQSAGHSVK